MKSLFHAIKRLMTLEEHCEDPHSEKCTHNVLKVVDSFASIGEMIASALTHCTVCKPGDAGCEKMREDADCAAQSTRLVDEVNNVARAAVGMDEHCDISKAERLFLDDDEDTIATGTGGTSVTLGLVALLPLTAVVAFMGGSRIAKTRGEFKRGTPSAHCSGGLHGWFKDCQDSGRVQAWQLRVPTHGPRGRAIGTHGSMSAHELDRPIGWLVYSWGLHGIP